jgi:hypothetical protein
MRLAAPAAKTERARRMVTIPEFVTFEVAEHLKGDVARGGCARAGRPRLHCAARRNASPTRIRPTGVAAGRARGGPGGVPVRQPAARGRDPGARGRGEPGPGGLSTWPHEYPDGRTALRREARRRRQGDRRGSNPCLHLQSVLGPDFVTCGDGRIRFLTCGFDALAVPIRFLTSPAVRGTNAGRDRHAGQRQCPHPVRFSVVEAKGTL